MRQQPKRSADDLVEYRRRTLLTREPGGWWSPWDEVVFNAHPAAKVIVPWLRGFFWTMEDDLPKRAELTTGGNALWITWIGCPPTVASIAERFLLRQYQRVLDDMVRFSDEIDFSRFENEWPEYLDPYVDNYKPYLKGLRND